MDRPRTETFWTAFLRKPARRGLRGVKLVVSDAHEGIKPPWPRCSMQLAAVPRALHAQRTGPSSLERPARRLGLHRYRGRLGRCRGRSPGDRCAGTG
ncbi:transposase [Bradyrhizobium stylosanthis]|uniref:transposase n=1 Tax=Bradyrhizobium stylosanthis TaxID=1803665 RepID=UPI003D322E84